MDVMVDLQCRLQRYDKITWSATLKQRFHGDLELNDRLSVALKKQLLEELGRLPDGQALCHCDFHAENVFFDGERYTIIDLLQISSGDPAADAVCTYVSYNFYSKDLAELYLGIYCEKSGISRERVRQWLPVYAGTLLGQVPEQYTPLLERFIAGDETL
jgi:thiamine kinase-like enzyme